MIVKAGLAGVSDAAMTEKRSPAEDRAARLAAALRANLHKRKAQARATPREGSDVASVEPDQPDQ